MTRQRGNKSEAVRRVGRKAARITLGVSEVGCAVLNSYSVGPELLGIYGGNEGGAQGGEGWDNMMRPFDSNEEEKRRERRRTSYGRKCSDKAERISRI